MNRRLTKAFIGALSFAAALSTAVVCNASAVSYTHLTLPTNSRV